jgi:hypothetical protein
MSGAEFVIKRLRAKPVDYTVTISHFVRAGEWTMRVGVNGSVDDRENRLRVAADLRMAAAWLEEDAEPAIDNPIPPEKAAT